MRETVNPDVLERFRLAVALQLGLRFDGDQQHRLVDVLGRRLAATGQDADTYLGHGTGFSPPEMGALAEALTVPETYFFRNIEQFHAVRHLVVPELLKKLPNRAGLRVLSAGCATGEEPFSLAILLQHTMGLGASASVLGVDISPSALAKARQGRYSTWSLREVPTGVIQRWFRTEGREVVLDDTIRQAVTFEQRNLAGENADLWEPNSFDIVFCRNVLMYLTPSATGALLDRIAQALVPGGFLFVGHAESLRGISPHFELCHSHGTFYHQLPSAPVAGVPGLALSLPAPSPRSTDWPPPLRPVGVAHGDEAWVHGIRRATRRIQQMVDDISRTSSTPVDGAARSEPSWSLRETLEFVRREDFGRALSALESLPRAAAGDPEVLVVRAMLLTHCGDLRQAQELCQRSLDIGEPSAQSHYVLALCREGLGDLQGAMDHDRIAASLDSHFAMPRLHLGLLARRAREWERMQQEFSRALALFEHEDPNRLLLFGGGFTRHALMTLCRAELVSGGATS